MMWKGNIIRVQDLFISEIKRLVPPPSHLEKLVRNVYSWAYAYFYSLRLEFVLKGNISEFNCYK